MHHHPALLDRTLQGRTKFKISSSFKILSSKCQTRSQHRGPQVAGSKIIGFKWLGGLRGRAKSWGGLESKPWQGAAAISDILDRRAHGMSHGEEQVAHRSVLGGDQVSAGVDQAVAAAGDQHR